MEFSPRFIADVNCIFRTGPRDVFNANNERSMLSMNCQFKKGNIYSKFLVSDVSYTKQIFDIPLIMREYSEDEIVANHECARTTAMGIPVDKLVYPLYMNGSVYIKSTFDTIIRAFFSYTKPEARISKVKLKQTDMEWYGGRGIIMDKDFNILLLITLTIKREGNSSYTWDKTVCRLNPSLFPTKDIMSRGIVNKLVPLLTQEGIIPSYKYSRSSLYFEGGTGRIGKVEIVVDPDINRFIESPEVPKAGIDEEDLHQCIIDNKLEILKMIRFR